jgi:hypothetical protein
VRPAGQWEIAHQPPSGVRPGLDLELGPTSSAASIIRRALASGAVRVAEIPEEFTSIAYTAVRLAKTAADNGQMGTFVQLVKLVKDIQDQNLRTLELADKAERLDAGTPTSIVREVAKEDAERIKRIIATHRASSLNVESSHAEPEADPPQHDHGGESPIDDILRAAAAEDQTDEDR